MANYNIVYSNELYHYGVKGMKWGKITSRSSTSSRKIIGSAINVNPYTGKATKINYHEIKTNKPKLSQAAKLVVGKAKVAKENIKNAIKEKQADSFSSKIEEARDNAKTSGNKPGSADIGKILNNAKINYSDGIKASGSLGLEKIRESVNLDERIKEAMHVVGSFDDAKLAEIDANMSTAGKLGIDYADYLLNKPMAKENEAYMESYLDAASELGELVKKKKKKVTAKKKSGGSRKTTSVKVKSNDLTGLTRPQRETPHEGQML